MGKDKIKIGIVGCGAIGSSISRRIVKDFSDFCLLSSIFDVSIESCEKVVKELSLDKSIIKNSLLSLIENCDLMIEAVSSDHTKDIIKQAIEAKRHVLVLSVGQILSELNLFNLAREKECSLLIPSGAIAGIDAIKAASMGRISSIKHITRKPVQGFYGNKYIEEKGINLDKLNKEKTIFSGSVLDAIKHFPQNINVAATLALASDAVDKISVEIITSPEFKSNSHQIEVKGEFGRMVTYTDNMVCPDNPKTSYLAVLSALQTLKEFCLNENIGT